MQKCPTVEVVRLPAGNSPEWIREAWIGVELPVCWEASPPAERVQTSHRMHAVRVADAVEALRLKGRESAALWWNDQALARPVGARMLFFNPKDCVAGGRGVS